MHEGGQLALPRLGIVLVFPGFCHHNLWLLVSSVEAPEMSVLILRDLWRPASSDLQNARAETRPPTEALGSGRIRRREKLALANKIRAKY